MKRTGFLFNLPDSLWIVEEKKYLRSLKNFGDFDDSFAIMKKKGLTMSENEEKIACPVCKKMIPKGAAVHAEGEEYVLHFCSLECLDYWKKEEKDKKE